MRRPEGATNPHDDAEPEDFLPLPHLPFHILLALAEGPLHGWGVVKKIREMSDGKEEPSTGSLYLAMSRLEERGLVADVDAPEGVDRRRRYMRLTPLGERVLVAETERLAGLVELSRRWTGS